MPKLSLALVALTLFTAQSACSTIDRRETEVDILWYREAGGIGGSSRGVISVEPNPTDRTRVGIVEGSPLQLGELWRASVWLAAFQASLALVQPLSDWLVFVELDHRGPGMDGPSAGALLTGAMMAGMTGAQVDPSFAITGSINPDGTIGPVSGLAQKFEAAEALGKKVFGYPLGQDKDIDLRTGKEISVPSLAEHSALEVREIPDIETAYAMMTGRTLERPTPLSPEQMAIPAEVRAALIEQTRSWLGSSEQNFNEYQALRLDDPGLEATWKGIDFAFGVAASTLEAGDVPAAFIDAAATFVDADAALLKAKLLRLVRDGRFPAAKDFVATVAGNVDSRLGELVSHLKDEAAGSRNDLMTFVDAFEALGTAVRHFSRGLAMVEASGEKVDAILFGLNQPGAQLTVELQAELSEHLFAPVEHLARANVFAFMSKQNLTFRGQGLAEGQPAGSSLDKRLIDRLGALFSTAGEANLRYFDSLVVQSVANARGVSRDSLRADFNDIIYQLLQPGLRHAMEEGLEGHFGADTQALSLVRLSTAVNTYIGASFLIAKYYSLSAETDEDFRVQKLGRGHVLPRMLALADAKALEHAARAKRVTGEVPIAARIAYDAGHTFAKRGDDTSRLRALEQLWRASVLSRMAVLLGT